MVGGDKAVFDQVLPIFQAMGKTITLLGPLGMGGFTKLANQIIVAVNLTALAEGADAGQEGRSRSRRCCSPRWPVGWPARKCLEQKTAQLRVGTYKPGFKIDLHYRTSGSSCESARALGVPLPATAVVQELFSALRVKGRGGLDHSGSSPLLEDLAGRLVEGHRRPGGPRPAGPAHPRSRSGASSKGDLARCRTSSSRASATSSSASWGRVPRQVLQRRPVRAPPVADGAVGLLRGRGRQRQARRRRAGASPARARSGCWARWRCSTHYHSQRIAQQLIRAVEEFFDENKATLHGCRELMRPAPAAPGDLPQVRLPAASRCWR